MRIVIQLWDGGNQIGQAFYADKDKPKAEKYFEGLIEILDGAELSGIEDPLEALLEGALDIPLPARRILEKMFLQGLNQNVETPS
jgi:hypothetical protein